ncbi:hypothetical protein [Aeromicrobium sp. Sec7.5]|uniref:hypothetical protein n=1 Tax=Aeromicrobium sp. Sec7.5 TaxID=3121276 RepID=UPI002FE4C1CB
MIAAAGSSGIETLTAWSTLGAAIATTVSVVFIAWQIRLTRKSVEATEQALALAHQEFRHSETLRVDAQRAAIDAEMPRITVEVYSQSSEVWRVDSLEPDAVTKADSTTALPFNEEFIVPRDDEVLLGVRVRLVVSNDGPRRAPLRLDRFGGGGREIVLGVGETHSELVGRVQPLREWVSIAEARANGEPGEERAIATVVLVHPGDMSAVEVHEVVQGGTVVEPVYANAAGWRLASFDRTLENPFGCVNAVVQPFTRRYWASRRDGRLLDPPNGSS